MQAFNVLDLKEIILFLHQLMLAASFFLRVSHYSVTIREPGKIISLIRMTITYDSGPAGDQLSSEAFRNSIWRCEFFTSGAPWSVRI